jgi:hypothetical protein
MPDEMPTIRSGFSAAMASKLRSPEDGTSGVAEPSAALAQGHTAEGWSPYQSRMPTGTTPSASTVSWSVNPTVTTRSGGFGITVVPNLCSTDTGKARAAVEAVVLTRSLEVRTCMPSKHMLGSPNGRLEGILPAGAGGEVSTEQFCSFMALARTPCSA